jgi:hypothetical protein
VPKRVAYLIGNQTFRPDSGLLPLQGPANDLAAFARLLSDRERGGFEVNAFLDKRHYQVLPKIEQALSTAAPSDLFLIYYSGHGKLDRNGGLCLATADTRKDTLLTTSIQARHLRALVDNSDCDQVVLLLDCCYSGAVGVRGDVESELRVVENAKGFYIMTASSDMQAAREEEPAAYARRSSRGCTEPVSVRRCRCCSWRAPAALAGIDRRTRLCCPAVPPSGRQSI